MSNTHLHLAKVEVNDEFYTQYKDIARELIYHGPNLKNKIIYCNCDSRKSNFYKYFKEYFNDIKPKKIYFSGYDEKETKLIEIKKTRGSFVEIEHELKGNGDILSDEIQEITKKVDIVITNPPFSIFRKGISTIFEMKKDFLIIANLNQLTEPTIFQGIKDNKISTGYTKPTKYGINEKEFSEVGVGIGYTTLPTKDELRTPPKPSNLIKYDNYDAYEVSKTSDIPTDFKGVVGVPITFLLTNYDKEKYEVLEVIDRPRINGSLIYKRIAIRIK